MKEKYITERKGKKANTFQIKIPHETSTGRTYYTESVRISDFPDRKSALSFAKHQRDKALIDLKANAVRTTLPTVKEAYNRYWEITGASSKTHDRHDSIYRHCIQQFDDIRLDKITASDIQKSLVDYAENHSQYCVKTATSIWRQIYRTATLDGHNIIDQSARIQPVRSKKPIQHRKKDISYNEFLQFLDALHEYSENATRYSKDVFADIETLLWLMYFTGARIAEILAIDSSDWNRENHTLRINKSVGSTAHATRQIVTTKTPQSVREIPLSDGAEIVLSQLSERSHSSPLLVASDGLPYEIDYISNIISLVSKKAGIKFNAYMLRHLFSTSMFRSGEDPAVIRDLMGHSSKSMSLDYAKSSFADREKAIKNRK